MESWSGVEWSLEWSGVELSLEWSGKCMNFRGIHS